MTDKLISEQLTEALESLTPDNWHKGSYFSFEKSKICMCAHGAVQLIINPKVQSIVAKHEPILAADIANDYACRQMIESVTDYASQEAKLAHPIASAAEAWDVLKYKKVTDECNWESRPKWVKDSKADIHYIMGIVGLTGSFNDDKLTTFEMVQTKFREAINLAKSLGV